MRSAIISDVHGNLAALETVLDYLEKAGITERICLGDIVGYGPKPNECVTLIKEYFQIYIKGNHDEAAANDIDIQHFSEYARQSMLWTRRVLSRENAVFLRKLPLSHDREQATFVHSAPANPNAWEYLFSKFVADTQFHLWDGKLAFVGHTHYPVVFSRNTGRIDPQSEMILDLSNDRYIVNVGSVGQPRDGDPRAALVLYDDTTGIVSYKRIPYPVRKTYSQILDAGLPSALATRLLTGH